MPQRAVTVGTTPTRLCSANPYRKGLMIYNTDTDVTVYLGDKNVRTSGDRMGIALLPSQLISMNLQDEERTKEWYGIVSSGTVVVVVYETW